MSLLNILSLAWGISGREVQRVLGRGLPGFRRRGRGHYRALGPITAERLGRVRPLDPRLPIALWISGGCTLWQARRACTGRGITSAVSRAAPYMLRSRVVLLALETRMAADFGAKCRGRYLSRSETATTFDVYKKKISAEILEAEMEPRFVELRNAMRRRFNLSGTLPSRSEVADELDISLRSYAGKYRRRTIARAKRDILSPGVEVKNPDDVLFEAMQRMGHDRDASPSEVAKELGFASEESLFAVYTRADYERALERHLTANVAELGPLEIDYDVQISRGKRKKKNKKTDTTHREPTRRLFAKARR